MNSLKTAGLTLGIDNWIIFDNDVVKHYSYQLSPVASLGEHLMFSQPFPNVH